MDKVKNVPTYCISIREAKVQSKSEVSGEVRTCITVVHANKDEAP